MSKPLVFTKPFGSKAVLPPPKQEGEIKAIIHDFKVDPSAPKEVVTGQAPKFKKTFPTKAGRRSKKRKSRRTRRQWKSMTRVQ
jgi:hypothetical protein